MTSAPPAPDAPGLAPIPWRRLAAWFALSRVLIWGVAGLSLHLVPKGPYFTAPASPLDWLRRWDANWYLEVAVNGYSYDPTKMSSVNFFPLYPLLVRAVAFVVRHADVAGYLVSNALCFVAAALLWRFVQSIESRPRAANFAVLFFLFGPVSFFFATIYSEATFTCGVVAALLAARQARWWLAGACGAAAAFTRSEGLLLVLPLALEFCMRHRSAAAWRAPRTWVSFLSTALPAAGTAAYFGFLTMRFGDPHAYATSQRFGGHTFSYFWDLFDTHHFATLSPFYQVWFAAAVAGGLALVAAGALLRQPLSLTLFAFAFCFLHFSVKTVECMPRFMSVVIPFYATLGVVAVRWPVAARVLLAASAALLAISVSLFANGYWFT